MTMNNLIMNFYGFSRLPFSKGITLKQIFKTQAHQEAQGMLQLGQVDDIILLTGAIGIGKSVALRAFTHELDTNRFIPVYVRGTGLSAGDLYKAVLHGLNVEVPHFASSARERFFKCIQELTKKPIVILDDAQELKDSAFLSLKSMVNFDCDSKNRITFVLAGQPELVLRIKMSHLASIRQRITLAHAMQSMSLEETCRYIDHHTKICENPKAIFSDSAKSEVFKRAHGIPRLVNTICYNAIAKGAATKLEVIDSTDLVALELLE